MSFINRKDVIGYDKTASETVLSTASADLLTLYSKSKTRLWIKEFGNNLSENGAWGSVTWTFLINGIPVPGYEAMLDPRGYGISRMAVGPIEVPPASIFVVRAQNDYTTTASVKIGASLLWDEENIN